MNTVQAPPRQPIVYSDEESNHESSSDDSDDAKIMKNTGNSLKRKISHPISTPSAETTKRKKFNVWSEILQEDAMENQFHDSKFFGGNRGHETYNHRMKYFTIGNDNEGCGDMLMK